MGLLYNFSMDKVRKSYLRMGLFLLLAGITISSAILYFSSLKEKYDLSVAVTRLKLQLENLEEEKQNLFNELEVKKQLEARLIKENAAFKEDIQSIQEQVSALNSVFISTRARVKSLTSKIRILQDENQALSADKQNLSAQLTEASQERDTLRSKFESVIELKKAIRDLKRKIHLARREIRRRVSPEQEPEPEPEEEPVVEGNRGFIIKDGRFTLPAYRIKIEVRPTFDRDAQ